jgi:hypothetical protein
MGVAAHETTVQGYAYAVFVRCSCGWFKWTKFGHKAAEKLARKHVENRAGTLRVEIVK